MKESVREY